MVQDMHEAKGVKQEMTTHVNNEAPGAGAIGNNPQNAAQQNNYQNMLRSSSANQGLLQQEASQNAAALNNYQNMLRSSSANQGLLQQEASQNAALNNYHNMLRSSSANQGLLQQEASQNAAALNNYRNMLRSSSANQSLLQQEASSVFKGPTSMHNGIQLEASRSFRGAQLGQFQHPVSFQQTMPHQNNFQGLGVSPQYQQHVIHQLLQEVKNTSNRSVSQQQPPNTPKANSGLASGAAIANSAASGEQTPHTNNGTGKGAAPMGTTGPSNLINSGASIVQRSSSFKSVSSNPAAAATAGGNAVTPKAESIHDMDELDHLITNELAESGLFMGEQQGGGGYSWNM
jgi:hypothetical protein